MDETPHERRERIAQLKMMAEDIRAVKIAVVGDRQLGIAGLVDEVHQLKQWRQRQDLRIASISGGTVVLLFLAKMLIGRL